MTPSSHIGGNEDQGGPGHQGPSPNRPASASGAALPAASPAARSAPPSRPAEDPRGVPAAVPDGSAVPGRVATPCPRPSLFLRSAVCGGRRGPRARVGPGQRPHTQAGHGCPRQDPRARKRLQSHVGADGPGCCRRELRSPGRLPAVDARWTPRLQPPDQSSFGRRPAMRWIPGSV